MDMHHTPGSDIHNGAPAPRLKYRDVADLPDDHPLQRAFLDQERALDAAYDRAANQAVTGPVTVDETSLEYFDRFVAGDRR